MKMFTNKKELSRYLLLITVAILGIYLFMPTLNYGFMSLVVLMVFIGIINFVLFDLPKETISKSSLIILTIVLLLGLIIPILTSWSLFHSEKYATLISNKKEIKTSVFSSDISPVDINKVRTVDQRLAYKLGSKKLGEDLALGSIVDIGEFNIQTVNNELVWVAPLVHSGFFKWLNSENGTPGYITVSATNENDVKLVLNKNIVYQTGAFLSEDIYRHIYLNGYMSSGFSDFTFEIDEEGNPFWVVTKFEKTIGYLGNEATGTIIVNATTGEINEYSIENTPSWVDRIQPEDFIVSQLDDWGMYKKGWFNANFTKEEVLTTTRGMSLVHGKNGKSYWYTGITSVGNDGSTVGFVLVDTRTKETNFYKVSGATEVRSMSSAEGIVQEKGYIATFPILYNVLGTPTYILTLKDNEGLVKNFAMVNVANYNIVGLGTDLKSALRNYKSKLVSKGNSISIDTDIELKKLKSSVERINSDIKNGNSYYYLKLVDSSKLFMMDSTLSEEIILTNIKDIVEIEFEDSNSKFISISKFKNTKL